MTSSRTRTDTGTGDLAVIGAMAAVCVAGLVMILHAYRWRFTVSTFFLFAGWVGVVATARLLWASFWAVAGESGGQVQRIELSMGRRGDLMREKKSVLRTIKDVEFDRDMGKMSGAEAQQLVKMYRRRAIEIIKELETVSADAASSSGLSVGQIIERELAARLGDAVAPIKVKLAPDALDKIQPVTIAAKAPVGRCPSCATDNDADAVFCKKCANRLTEDDA